jgi:hypothetical protein
VEDVAGAGTIIGVVDSGVDFDHPDLKSKSCCPGRRSSAVGTSSCGNGEWESGPQELDDDAESRRLWTLAPRRATPMTTPRGPAVRAAAGG